MPALPKDPSTRARRNVAATRAVLRRDLSVRMPALPDRVWQPLTLAWWVDVWASPMAPEFEASDVHGLFMLALLVDDFWSADAPSSRMSLAAEIRQQSQRFGLSPIDRRRLQWEVERVEDAQEKGARRRGRVPAPSRRSADPRSVLRPVS